jgi:hypothetical protein
MLIFGVLLKSLTGVRTIEGQIPVSELSRTPTVSMIKGQIVVSDLSRTPKVSIIKG